MKNLFSAHCYPLLITHMIVGLPHFSRKWLFDESLGESRNGRFPINYFLNLSDLIDVIVG